MGKVVTKEWTKAQSAETGFLAMFFNHSQLLPIISKNGWSNIYKSYQCSSDEHEIYTATVCMRIAILVQLRNFRIHTSAKSV